MALQEFVSLEHGQKAYLDLVKEFEGKLNFGEHAMTLAAWSDRVAGLARPTNFPVDFLKSFVERTNSVLIDACREWNVGSDRLLSNTKAFVHIWSSLQFVLCLPSTVSSDRVIRELFGDGLNWAGCLFLSILGQSEVYQGMSINGNMLALAQLDLGFAWPPTAAQASPTKNAVDQASALRPDVQRYLDNAAFFAAINDHAFAALKVLRSARRSARASARISHAAQ
nr:Cytoplasmic FMR1-interacting protein 2 [Polyrhizophydium stewartii]